MTSRKTTQTTQSIAIFATLISMLILLLAFVVGCTVQATTLDDSKATPENTNQVASASNQFAFDLYDQYKDSEAGKNIFFSPWSISSALAMTYEGARGQTATEMQNVLHIPADATVRQPSYAKLYNVINKPDKQYQLSTANALWAQQDYKFLDEYMSLNKNYYGAEVRNLDFVTQSEASRQTINKWVEGQTNSKIKDLLPKGSITGDTRLVLTNAVYFKGDWVWQFEKKNTIDADFHVTKDETVTTKMMSMKMSGEVKAKFNYAENDDMQMIELPYKGNEITMTIILPKENDIAAFEGQLTAQKLTEWQGMMSERSIPVYLPKFKFDTEYKMVPTLTTLGMPSAFCDTTPYNADFSGMDGTKFLCISDVIHKAYIDVNEEGTEAAAATAVVVGETSVGPPRSEFRADHPFIFIIQEKSTGTILFMGRMMDPTK